MVNARLTYKPPSRMNSSSIGSPSHGPYAKMKLMTLLFPHTQLNVGPHAGVPCRNRIPQTNLPAIETLSQVEVGLVDNDCPKPPSWHNCSIDATSFTPLRRATYVQPHVFDRWCVASSGHSQRDESLVGDPLTEIPDGPRREVHLRSEDLSLPLAYTFASALDAADQDQVITSFRGDSITLISFGHKLHYLEQRTVQLRAQDFHRWRECLRTLWADFDDGTFFAIHNIIPPPVLGRSTVSTIIQLAPISVHASLVLLQFVPSSPPPEDPFVEIIPAISMRRNVFQACGQHLVLEPTAIVKASEFGILEYLNKFNLVPSFGSSLTIFPEMRSASLRASQQTYPWLGIR